MDATLKVALDEYFERASELKPNLFVLVRDDREVSPLIEATFSEEEPFMLTASDDQEIFAGDILVYPKTRQFCFIDDIRHFPAKKIFLIHYYTDFDFE